MSTQPPFLINRIQDHQRDKARRYHNIAHVPGFTIFLHPTEAFAIPDAPILIPEPGQISGLRAAFGERQRQARVRFIDAFAPGLPLALLEIGFTECSRHEVMYCTADRLIQPAVVADLTFIVLSSESSLDEIKEGWDTNARGFGEDTHATDEIAEAFRRSLITGRGFTARLAGQPVAAGMYDEVQNGVTELIGITTLPEYRGRGIAAALTAKMTQTAFEQGVELVYLVAATSTANRVYTRAGFQTCANLVEYEDKELPWE